MAGGIEDGVGLIDVVEKRKKKRLQKVKITKITSPGPFFNVYPGRIIPKPVLTPKTFLAIYYLWPLSAFLTSAKSTMSHLPTARPDLNLYGLVHVHSQRESVCVRIFLADLIPSPWMTVCPMLSLAVSEREQFLPGRHYDSNLLWL